MTVSKQWVDKTRGILKELVINLRDQKKIADLEHMNLKLNFISDDDFVLSLEYIKRGHIKMDNSITSIGEL